MGNPHIIEIYFDRVDFLIGSTYPPQHSLQTGIIFDVHKIATSIRDLFSESEAVHIRLKMNDPAGTFEPIECEEQDKNNQSRQNECDKFGT